MDFVINIKPQNPIDFFSKDVDIEQLYTEIEENLNLYIGRDATFDRIIAFKAYTQLIFIFATTINSIQNRLVSRPHSSLVRKVYIVTSGKHQIL